MYIKKIFTLVVVTIVTPLLLVFIIMMPVVFFGPLLLPLSSIAAGLACGLVATSPFFFLFTSWYVRRWLLAEKRHILAVGMDTALWAVSSLSDRGVVIDYVTFERYDPEGRSTPVFSEGAWTELSVSYSKAMLWCCSWVESKDTLIGCFVVSVATWWWMFSRTALRLLNAVFWTWVVVCSAVAFGPPQFTHTMLQIFLRMAFYCTPPGWLHLRVRLEYARLWLISLVLDLSLIGAAIDDSVAAHYSERLAGRRRKFGAAFKQATMASVKFISAVRLPAFVRNRFQRSVTKADLEKGRQLMADLGWPINVNITDEQSEFAPPVAGKEFADWKVADTDFHTGIKTLKLEIKESLAALEGVAPAYFRTEEYKSVENELRSTARYFVDRDVNSSIDVLDDVWHILKPIFVSSRLTKFGDIIYAWEKKYALGFWMTDEQGRRKLSRRSFIAKVGYPVFKEMWARTFVRASEIMPVSHVSVKDEALSPAKFLADKVRTVIGAPLSHYIGATIFGHQPNHNFQFDGTPIKVGMPLNGYWMGRLFDRHSRFSTHIEGDFENFDSTVEGPVKRVVKEVRKRGFASHKDHKAICDLIDGMYDQLDNMFLGHTSTGEVYKKGSGMSTGHNSTSMDNSVALVTFYIMAWKTITGLSAREFLHFNELSAYGDDHMLSVMATAPRSWNAKNIRTTMARWGATNNVVVKKLSDMTFLGKLNSPVTPAFRRELDACGVEGVTRVIWHDKARLVGKLTAKIKSTEPTYRAARLVSYLQLTAHHREVYDAIAKELNTPILLKIVTNTIGGIPSYEEIVRNWYSPSHTTPKPPVDDPEEEWENNGKLIVIGTPSLFDHILQALSVLPDLLNPVLFNYGPTRALTGILSGHLQWVPTLLQAANGIASYSNLDYHLKRTPYNWLDSDLVLPQRFPESFTTLVVRHWIFLCYLWVRPKFKSLLTLNWALKKTADFAFLFKAQIITDLPRDLMPFDQVLVCAILDWLVIPGDPLKFLLLVDVPDIASWIDLAYNRILSFVWTSVPANFGEVDAVIRALDKANTSMVVEAPTGSGKSTALIAHINLSQPVNHRKLIVIEPRTLLVVGLVAYMRDAFGVSVTGATTGMVFDPSCAIWYMTPQSFLGHLHLMNKHDLFVVDECHVNEPLVHLLAEMIPKWGFRTLLVSATPSKANVEKASFHVSIPISMVYSVREVSEDIPSRGDYLKEVIDRINNTPRHVKMLVIVNTPEQCDHVLRKSNYSAQCLSSRHSPVLLDRQRYIATNVVDVGITIPGVRTVISGNWVYGGGGQHYSMSDNTYRQRRGRVGRTNNGTFLVLRAPVDDLKTEEFSDIKSGWKEAMLAGISPVLGWQTCPKEMAEIFDLGELSDTQVKDFARVSHIFLGNFRQMKAIEQENMLIEPTAGPAAVLVPTGSIGHFSGSIPQDLSAASAEGQALLGRLLRAIKAGDNVYALLKERLATVRTGPLYRVANIITGLGSDPSSWRPELKGSARDAGDVDFDNEIKQILEMLETIKRT